MKLIIKPFLSEILPTMQHMKGPLKFTSTQSKKLENFQIISRLNEIQYKIHGWTRLPGKCNLENDFSVKYSKNLEKTLKSMVEIFIV